MRLDSGFLQIFFTQAYLNILLRLSPSNEIFPRDFSFKFNFFEKWMVDKKKVYAPFYLVILKKEIAC